MLFNIGKLIVNTYVAGRFGMKAVVNCVQTDKADKGLHGQNVLQSVVDR